MLGTETAQVLVGVADGDVGAVLDAAVAEARRRDVGVHLVHAVGPSLLSADTDSWAVIDRTLRREGGELLEEAARAAGQRAGGDVPVSTELVHGPVVPALTALSQDAPVVFLQRRSRRHVPTLSVTNGVAARSHTPVVVVPAGAAGPPAGAPLVVGVKDAEQSTEVVRAALDAARSRAVGLRIVHAWHYSGYDDLVFAGAAGTEHEDGLRAAFTGALRDLLAEYPDVDTELVVEHGRHADVLVRQSRDASLVVLGRHQSRVPLAPHLGSVVRAVLREAACPVMVVDPLVAGEPVPEVVGEVPAGQGGAQGSPVVAAVDGSPGSGGAVRRAVHEAGAVGSVVRLVHVVPDFVPVSTMMPLTPADLSETGRVVLRAAEQVARAADPEVEVESRLVRGARARAIAEAATDARLLVVGRDRPLSQRLVTGRTATAVAGRASCPVESVPADWSAEGALGVVVVGVRSPEHAEHVLAHALALAAGRGARLVVLHSWKMPSGYDDVIEARVDAEEWDRRCRAQLEPVLEQVRAGFPEVPIEVRIVHDRPAHALVAASQEADLVVLMRRHHLGPDAWRLGGTARAVLGAAHCAVRIVAPPATPQAAGAPVERSDQLSASGR